MSDVLTSPFGGRLTSSWGWREILGRPLTFHRGQDIAPPIAGTRGLPVYAPCDLEIVYVSEGTYSKAQGKWLGNDYTFTWNTGPVVVARGRGKWSSYWFLFGHMSGITVAAGQKVDVGHVLGKADDKGNVQGVHLHFEIWTSSKQGGGNAEGNTIDPAAFYARHGVRLGSAPSLTKTPTKNPFDEQDWFDMATEKQLEAVVDRVVRPIVAHHTNALHIALRTDTQAAAQQVIDRVAQIPGVTGADVERIRVAVLGDRHPKTPGTDLRGAVTTTMLDVKALTTLVESLAGALAATNNGEAFDTDKFLDGMEARQRAVLSEFVGDLSADVTLTIGKKA